MKILQAVKILSVKKTAQNLKRGGENAFNQIFSRREQAYCEPKRMKAEHYAARLAAKEALLEACKIKSSKHPRLCALEIGRRPTGKPYFRLSPPIKRLLKLSTKTQIELSLAHEREVAMAAVLIVMP